jgi:hypothetical protein
MWRPRARIPVRYEVRTRKPHRIRRRDGKPGHASRRRDDFGCEGVALRGAARQGPRSDCILSRSAPPGADRWRCGRGRNSISSRPIYLEPANISRAGQEADPIPLALAIAKSDGRIFQEFVPDVVAAMHSCGGMLPTFGRDNPAVDAKILTSGIREISTPLQVSNEALRAFAYRPRSPACGGGRYGSCAGDTCGARAISRSRERDAEMWTKVFRRSRACAKCASLSTHRAPNL